ncbi:MAG: glycoside hydrolase family 43 protein [Clostridia bacterium]
MGTVRNPVLPGFHPDPSILYRDGWYYLANSTFEWFGGVEIHRSRDLANWEFICRPLSTMQHLDMTGNPASGGIWAPCLSWAEGRFWLIFTDVKTWNIEPFKDTPNYLCTAENITGPWSQPVFLNCSGFDPSLFHDEDGRKWLVNMEWDYRKPGTAKFSGILLQELDASSLSLKGPVTKIWKGTDIGLVEGPHLYRKDGWYYLVCAEGGTEYEHAVSVARSRSITGPYETHPKNPLCSSRGDGSLYLQKAGHGSWCQGRDGQWTLACLVGRPLPGTQRCVLGRETALAPLVWVDDWPYLASGGNKPPASFEVPWSTASVPERAMEYHFDAAGSGRFLEDFMTLRLPFDGDRFSFTQRPGWLAIRGGESLICRHGQSLVARRQQDYDFDAQTRVDFDSNSFQQMAGLVYRYDENNWYYLCITWDENIGSRILKLLMMDAGGFSMPPMAISLAGADSGRGTDQTEGVLAPQPDGIPLPAGPVRLRAEVRGPDLRFMWATDEGVWQPAGPVLDASILSDEYDSQGFTGAFVGMACQDLENRSATAYFEYFRYTAGRSTSGTAP